MQNRIADIEDSEITIFPLQLKNVEKCAKINYKYNLHNYLFYLVIDRIDNDPSKTDTDMLIQILNKIKNPL